MKEHLFAMRAPPALVARWEKCVELWGEDSGPARGALLEILNDEYDDYMAVLLLLLTEKTWTVDAVIWDQGTTASRLTIGTGETPLEALQYAVRYSASE